MNNVFTSINALFLNNTKCVFFRETNFTKKPWTCQNCNFSRILALLWDLFMHGHYAMVDYVDDCWIVFEADSFGWWWLKSLLFVVGFTILGLSITVLMELEENLEGDISICKLKSESTSHSVLKFKEKLIIQEYSISWIFFFWNFWLCILTVHHQKQRR